MKCLYCGEPLGLDDNFCPECGESTKLTKNAVNAEVEGTTKKTVEVPADKNIIVKQRNAARARNRILVATNVVMLAATASAIVYGMRCKRVSAIKNTLVKHFIKRCLK